MVRDIDQRMPAVFIGHGSPTNAIEDSEFSRAWASLGKELPRPRAILCISAHWETAGTQVTSMEQPRTIHDFSGFPQALYEVQYPAPGSPGLAQRVGEVVTRAEVRPDLSRGLDHGAWSVLHRMYPDADIPVVQLSLDQTQPPAFHYALAQELRPLRAEGVLVLGSGNIVHNLRTLEWHDVAFDWALEFDEAIRRLIVDGDHDAIVHYEQLGESASLSVPTNEHYLPLLYVLAQQDEADAVTFFAEKVTLGSISMRSLRVG